MKGAKTDWRLLDCALVAGAAVALPVGVFLGRSGSAIGNSDAAAERASIGMRDVYSPNFRSDPFVIEQQRRVVEALEQSCRQSKLHCEEARQARLRIREVAAGK